MEGIQTSEETLTAKEIKSLLEDFVTQSDYCGFEVYVITKSNPQLRRMQFYETDTENFRHKLKRTIIRILQTKYISADADYVSADRIVDEQHKFYIVTTGKDYDPFAMLKTKAVNFRKKDISEATGLAFLIRLGERQIWVYQHIWPMMVSNKTGENLFGRIVSKNEGDIFEEVFDPAITFAERIDCLILDNCIIVSDYKLLQRFFEFREYIRIRTKKVIRKIDEKGIVANIAKLNEYVERGQGNPKYAKKMLRITDSKVLEMERSKLWKSIHKSSRWKGKINEKDGQFILETYQQVEELIDLLDERYTRSDITGVEYDTDVKHVADQ